MLQPLVFSSSEERADDIGEAQARMSMYKRASGLGCAMQCTWRDPMLGLVRWMRAGEEGHDDGGICLHWCCLGSSFIAV